VAKHAEKMEKRSRNSMKPDAETPAPNCGNCETVAMYDETGLAVEDGTRAKKYLVRGPRTGLLKWLR